jgi:hypothetical protein
VWRMLLAKLAVLLQLQPVWRFLFILGGRIVSVLAF